jgi:hypothetical protein
MRYTEYPLIEEVPIRRLAGSEYALLAWLSVRIVVVLTVLPVALRCLTVARLVRLLTPRRMGATRRPALLWRSADAVDWLVDRRPFRFWGHCLRRSLLLYFAATRAGYPVMVVVGARRDGSGVTGHAWIELDGLPLLEPGEHPEREFVVMERLPRSQVDL